MSDSFHSVLRKLSPPVLSLNAQAALGAVRVPKRSQFSLLLRHFLERFFNHETVSPDGDAKARLVLIAFTTGLPGFVVALMLWPVYHPLLRPRHPPYWAQVDHHFIFVLYSFVAMGIVTVFEWELFFPDLLDIHVLTTLPISNRKLFMARVAAIAILVIGFLFDANIFGFLALPSAVDPTNLPRFLAGHLLAVGASGLFSAAAILALQGILLSVLGARLFRKVSLLVQGLAVSILLMLLLLLSLFSTVDSILLKSGSIYALCFPPFWFLGIFQRVIEGPAALPVYVTLSRIGCMATVVVVLVAMLTYPLAYLRRVRQLVEGAGTQSARNRFAYPLRGALHVAFARRPATRAVFHFISQTLLRVQRYRIYLVLYGSVGLSVVVATVFRLAVIGREVHMQVSADGVRATIGILPFWIVAGLRIAFTSSGNQQGSWILRVVHGRPPRFDTATDLLKAARSWVLIWTTIITSSAWLALRTIAPPELLTMPATLSQVLLVAGLCLLLTDVLFLDVTVIPFTGEAAREQPSLAITFLKCFAFIPVVAWLPLACETWIEESTWHFPVAVVVIATLHIALTRRHRSIVREHCNLRDLEEGEEDFPMKLGLRD